MSGSRRPYIGLSDAQANADALVRRSAPFAVESEASIRSAWDFRTREPADLREAVRMIRRAYADEVPTKLHDHNIGIDGTPRWTTRAEGYIFGSPSGDDARTNPENGERDLVGYFHSPFRAALDNMAHGDEATQRRGRIVAHVAIGAQGPARAAMLEHAHPLDAKLVAEDALRGFLRNLSAIRLHLRTVEEASQVA
jgi:hypothetical protein